MRIESGQAAVVTGAASGIGYALAAQLAGRGVSVAMADIEGPAVVAAADSLTQRGAHILRQVCDVSDQAQVNALHDAAFSEFGRVDMVFNNAGVVLPFRGLWEHDLKDWTWLMGVNLWGVVHGMRAFVPGFVEKGSGHVVNIASLAGVGTYPFNGPYNAAKHAVVALTETLADELAEVAPGVRATVVCPGFVATRIRDADRNRPERLRVSGLDQPAARSFSSPSATSPQLTADQMARLALEGVEKDKLHVFTPGAEAPVEARFARLIQDL